MAKIVLVLQIYISGSRNKGRNRPLKEKQIYSCMKIYTYTHTHIHTDGEGAINFEATRTENRIYKAESRGKKL